MSQHFISWTDIIKTTNKDTARKIKKLQKHLRITGVICNYFKYQKPKQEMVTVVKRKIVSIDEDKCDGCGLCIPACHEGAIEIVDGKARLKEERLCDGLGDCLGECPQDAIKIEVREADEFDEEAVAREMAKMKARGSAGNTSAGAADGRSTIPTGGGCPSARFNNLSQNASPCPGAASSRTAASAEQKKSGAAANQANSRNASASDSAHSARNSRNASASAQPAKSRGAQSESSADSSRSQASSDDISLSIKSQLNQWPVQLTLLPESAPIFDGADLLISADCVAHAYADFHLDLLKDRKLVIGCPKLDDNNYYTEKLTSIFAQNDINSVTVAIMEVPCCGGLRHAVNQALSRVDKDIPLEEIVFTVSGEKK